MNSSLMEVLMPGATHDTLISFGGNIKALEQKGDYVTVGGTGILYGHEKMTDLVGDWFTPDTYLGAHRGNGVDTMLHHGIPLKPELLDLRNSYQRKVYEMVEAGLLSWSSGAPPHGVKRKANVPCGEITRWLIAEFSYTPTPCEPRLTNIVPLKALLGGQASFGEPIFPIDSHSISAPILEMLKDGSRAGLSFSDHCEAVLAAVEGFRGRLFDWFDDRSSSRKTGRVFSAAKWERLDELCVGLGLTYGAMRALLDENRPAEHKSANEHGQLTHIRQQCLDDAILQARIRFAELAARLYGVRV